MISGTISAGEFLAAQRLHLQPMVRRQLLVLAILVVVGLLTIGVGYFFPGIVIFGAGAGGFIGHFVLHKWSLPRRHLRLFNQQVSLRDRFTYSWDAEHVSVVTDSGQAKRPWVIYVKSKDNDQVFLLYHSDIMFEVIPKPWFHSLEQIEAFRRLVSRVGT